MSRLPDVKRGEAISFRFDGDAIEAYRGETVASALWAAGQLQLRRSARIGAPRGVFCSMGICFDCLVVHEGRAERACMLLVEDGMELLSHG